jgi:hypothetical protein
MVLTKRPLPVDAVDLDVETHNPFHHPVEKLRILVRAPRLRPPAFLAIDHNRPEDHS